MSKLSQGAALGASLFLVFALAGCEDEAQKAQAARLEQLKTKLKSSLATLEQESAGAPYAQVCKSAAQARAIALELHDDAAVTTIDGLVNGAREASAKTLQQSYAKVESRAKEALDKSDPAQAAQACDEALQAIDHAPAPVLAKFGKELDALRVQLASRADAARRAKEVLATAKQLKDESKNLEARAVCRSFEVVDSLRSSPFKPLVFALMNEIPEKTEEETFLTIFDGTDPQQKYYFTRQHEFTWKIENNLLSGDNTEYPDGPESTIWLGDDGTGWSDYVVELRFKVDGVGLNVLVRAAKKPSDDDEGDRATTFDTIPLTTNDGVPAGAWAQARIVVKGNKATYTVNGGAAKTVDLSAPKGLLGFSLPGNADVKVQNLRIHLLDKDAKAPKIKAPEEPKPGDDDTKGKGKKGRKGKKKDAAKPAEGDEKKGDEKKDDEKKDEGKEGG